MKLYKPGHILPVLPSAELLAPGRHQALLQQVFDMSQLDRDTFSLLYDPVINNFTEFVQLLPTTVEGVLSSLLNESLARGTLAMRAYTVEYGDEIDPLMNYAAFTAGLLREVSKVVTLYRVVLCKKKGDYIDDWYPFGGPMGQHAEFYKIYPLAPVYQRLDVSITPMLARQLMPKEGFDWLTADLLVFADWLDALQGEGGFGGKLCHIFGLMKREDLFNLIESLPQIDVEMLLSEDTQHGEAFYEWLKNGIDSGEIKVNSSESGVHIVTDGVFLEGTKIFHQFSLLSSAAVNDKVVFQQFGNLMGIVLKSSYDGLNAQYFSKNTAQSVAQGKGFAGSMGRRQGSMLSGMLVSDKARIITSGKSVEVSTQLQSKQAHTSASHKVPGSLAQSTLTNKPKSS